MQIIKGVLSPEVLAEFNKVLENSEFVNGETSAGKVAGEVKNNLELDPQSPNRDLLNKAVMGAIMSNDNFQYGAMPARISTPIFAKYTSGMTYGYHVDDPIMGGQIAGAQQYRSDISLTLFLNNPDEYDGGELSIKTPLGEHSIKLNAGDMVVYPSSSLHQVNPITKGERKVVVTWMQSMVREPSQREILFNLWQARNRLFEEEKSETTDLVDISYVNLLRMWSNP